MKNNEQAKALTELLAEAESVLVGLDFAYGMHGRSADKVLIDLIRDLVTWIAQPSAQDDVAAVRDAALEEGIEKAAKLIEQKVQDYVDDHGIYDRDTGAVEFPGDGEIYVGEMTELAEDIRALKSAAPTAQPQEKDGL